MPFVPFPTTTAKLELFFRQDGQAIENVTHWRLTAAATEINLEQLCLDAINWWDTVMQPLVTSKVELVNTKATSLATATSSAVEISTGLPLSGGGAPTSLPNNVTVVAKLLTAKRGRSFRGRIYHVGLHQAQVSENSLIGAAQIALTSAYNSLTIPGLFSGAKLVVASRVSNGAERSLGVVTDCTAVTVNEVLDSQRRRLPERGA